MSPSGSAESCSDAAGGPADDGRDSSVVSSEGAEWSVASVSYGSVVSADSSSEVAEAVVAASGSRDASSSGEAAGCVTAGSDGSVYAGPECAEACSDDGWSAGYG